MPEIDSTAWKLDIGGLVTKPRSISLQDLKARPRKEHILTIECSGNPPAGGLVANEKWTGTPLAPILKEAGIQPAGIEVVFFAADSGTEKIRDAEYRQNFARSLSPRGCRKEQRAARLRTPWQASPEGSRRAP